MKKLVLIGIFAQCLGVIMCINNTSTNSSDPNKDMYVIHAMVYQVGIITNKTDDKPANDTMGNQEALTFFRTNGSKVDLSSIPAPLLTNVTAQSMIQVAPKTSAQDEKPKVSWSALKDIASLPQSSQSIQTENGGLKIVRRRSFKNGISDMIGDLELKDETGQEAVYRRSVSEMELSKREATEDKANMKVVKGAAVIPQGAGVQSVALPPLLTLNNNLSDIPVPIPNTSIVHYAKINTLIRKP